MTQTKIKMAQLIDNYEQCSPVPKTTLYWTLIDAGSFRGELPYPFGHPFFGHLNIAIKSGRLPVLVTV